MSLNRLVLALAAVVCAGAVGVIWFGRSIEAGGHTPDLVSLALLGVAAVVGLLGALVNRASAWTLVAVALLLTAYTGLTLHDVGAAWRAGLQVLAPAWLSAIVMLGLALRGVHVAVAGRKPAQGVTESSLHASLGRRAS